MPKTRRLETEEQREERLLIADRERKDSAALEDAAMDRMIKRSIAQFGP